MTPRRPRIATVVAHVAATAPVPLRSPPVGDKRRGAAATARTSWRHPSQWGHPHRQVFVPSKTDQTARCWQRGVRVLLEMHLEDLKALEDSKRITQRRRYKNGHVLRDEQNVRSRFPKGKQTRRHRSRQQTMWRLPCPRRMTTDTTRGLTQSLWVWVLCVCLCRLAALVPKSTSANTRCIYIANTEGIIN